MMEVRVQLVGDSGVFASSMKTSRDVGFRAAIRAIGHIMRANL